MSGMRKDGHVVFKPVLGNMTEIGTLVVDQKHRGKNVGKLLSRARFAFMAAAPKRFQDIVFAEMRGPIDPETEKPECGDWLSNRLFGMTMVKADAMLSKQGHDDVYGKKKMPVISLNEIPEAISAQFGMAHPSSQRAQDILMKYEGFQNAGYFDAAQGGPQVHSQITDIKTVRYIQNLYQTPSKPFVIKGTSAQLDDSQPNVILTNHAEGKEFQAACLNVNIDQDGVTISCEAAKILDLQTGDQIAYTPFIQPNPAHAQSAAKQSPSRPASSWHL